MITSTVEPIVIFSMVEVETMPFGWLLEMILSMEVVGSILSIMETALPSLLT